MDTAISKFPRAQALLLALAFSAGPAVCNSSDIYNAVTHELSIPVLSYGNATFSNIVVTPGRVLSIAGGTPTGLEDAYFYSFAIYGYELYAASVLVGATTYTNVTATIAAMDSLGGVSGADTYDGTYLYIPTVLVGGKMFNFGIITVAGIDGLAGGFPKSTVDTYNTATHELTIPAVQVGAKAYTNVTVTVGSVVGVNGSGPGGGANSSTCYNPTYYATGTTMDLFYEDSFVGATSRYEAKSVVVAPSTFGGVTNAVGIQITTTTSQGASTATEYYDISPSPIIRQLGLGSSAAGNQVFTPGVQFGGALSYGQALQTTGVLSYTGGSSNYTTDYVFEGLEDVTVPAGTFHAACKWRLGENIGQGPTTITTWGSHQGVLLKVGSSELQAGSTFNGAPVGP